MGILLDRLKEKKLLVSDGAWGTLLQAQGLASGDCPEEWNVSHPDVVQSVAAAYADAGSDIILTNTFGGSSLKLAKAGFEDRAHEFNKAGAENSLAAAPDAVIAGSVGPTGDFVQPLGTISEEQMEAVFTEQIEAMLQAGLRVICVETMMAIEEAVCAIRAAKKLDPAADVICTMTFDRTPKGFKTMMGVDCQRAAEALVEAGADIVGSNCGNGIEQMVDIATEFKAHTNKPLLIQANAGLPQLVDGKTVFQQDPNVMAAKVKTLVDAGASIIGGCCGTTPDHIAAMRNVLDTLR